MTDTPTNFGRTIQLFLVNGTPSGLMIATLHGWTGTVMVCQSTSFEQLLIRSELKKTGVYLLFSREDIDNPLKSKIYIGEADNV